MYLMQKKKTKNDKVYLNKGYIIVTSTMMITISGDDVDDESGDESR